MTENAFHAIIDAAAKWRRQNPDDELEQVPADTVETAKRALDIACSVGSDPEAIQFHCTALPDGSLSMGWEMGDFRWCLDAFGRDFVKVLTDRRTGVADSQRGHCPEFRP